MLINPYCITLCLSYSDNFQDWFLNTKRKEGEDVEKEIDNRLNWSFKDIFDLKPCFQIFSSKTTFRTVLTLIDAQKSRSKFKNSQLSAHILNTIPTKPPESKKNMDDLSRFKIKEKICRKRNIITNKTRRK